MLDPLAVKAFTVGIFSACSLLLGSAASLFWRPGDRTIAFLMAVGGGALLAALAIDLVGEALERGHYYSLSTGCLIGGLLFIALDLVVSDYGGFKRKAATTIYHVRRLEHRRYKRILSGISHTDIFKHLSTRDFKALSNSIQSRDYKKGDRIYQPGDPCEELSIILAGEVELFSLDNGERWSTKVIENQAFGRLAFISGTPHTAGAAAACDTTLLTVPRRAFNALLLSSSALQQVMHRWLRSDELTRYLLMHHKLSEPSVLQWTDEAVQSLIHRGRIPPAIRPNRRPREFCAMADRINRVPFFHGLPADDLAEITSRLLFKQYSQGQTIYHNGEPSDRMYIVHHGEVSLIDARNTTSHPEVLSASDAFGSFSLVTRSQHSVSAIAALDTGVWELRRADFEELLLNSQPFKDRVKHFLQQQDLANYLQTRLHLDDDKWSRFVQDAFKNIDKGLGVQAAKPVLDHLDGHGSAAIAIWLGIMLDGIPESLVIGSSMIHSKVSLSLLVGLLISNFPEALSSSIGMRRQGLTTMRILVMWTSIVLMTGIGAAIGNLFFVGVEPFIFALVEGIAAGAMLTMIAQTMLPEAYFKGGSIVGFATLLGFLAAILSKSLN